MSPRYGSDHIRQQLDEVPDSPGVYLWKDAGGTVLYVGKAKALRKRMKQYAQGHDDRAMVPEMMSRVASFDYVVTANEVESLILENNLIKEHHPRYNVDYRDDKTYPYIALTTADPFPAIKYTREKHRAGTPTSGRIPTPGPRAPPSTSSAASIRSAAQTASSGSASPRTGASPPASPVSTTTSAKAPVRAWAPSRAPTTQGSSPRSRCS